MAYPAKTDRACILAAALRQVEDEGIECLAVRSVAAKLGLAPNALYRYFASLADLKGAIAEEARLRVLEAMQKAAAGKNPADTIRAISKAYLRFAEEQPRVFALYFKASGTDGDAPQCTPQCARNSEFFWEQVARVYGKKRAPEASHALWAFLYGLVMLRQAGVLSEEQMGVSLKFGLAMWLDKA